jgi:hypothetical protein
MKKIGSAAKHMYVIFLSRIFFFRVKISANHKANIQKLKEPKELIESKSLAVLSVLCRLWMPVMP